MYKKTYRIEGTKGIKVVVAGKKYELGEDISYKVWERSMFDDFDDTKRDAFWDGGPIEASAQATTNDEIWWIFDNLQDLYDWIEREDWEANIEGVIFLRTIDAQVAGCTPAMSKAHGGHFLFTGKLPASCRQVRHIYFILSDFQAR